MAAARALRAAASLLGPSRRRIGALGSHSATSSSGYAGSSSRTCLAQAACPRGQVRAVSSARLALESLQLRKEFVEGVRLIIYDKDGTLTHCDRAFGPWVVDLVANLRALGWISDEDHAYRKVGYVAADGSFDKTAVVVHGSNDDMVEELCSAAWRDHRPTASTAEIDPAFRVRFLEKTTEAGLWHVDPEKYLTRETLDICCDEERFLRLLEEMRANGLEFGVCTSDHRSSTLKTLEVIGAMGMLTKDHPADEAEARVKNLICCADDQDVPLKPAAGGIERVLRFAGVDATAAVMVGDTFTDMEAGARAGLRKLVFVESDHSAAEVYDWVAAKASIFQDTGVQIVEVREEGFRRSSSNAETGNVVLYVMKDIGLMLE